MVLAAQSVADAPAVLVAGNTAQGVFFAVEDEALVGIDLEAAAAETGGNVVKDIAVFHQFSTAAVQVGILAAVPQVTEPTSPAPPALAGGFFTAEPSWRPLKQVDKVIY